MEHCADPALWACNSSLTAQLAMRHGAALAAMTDWVGPHWQPISRAAQPAALIALMRQTVWSCGGFVSPKLRLKVLNEKGNPQRNAVDRRGSDPGRRWKPR